MSLVHTVTGYWTAVTGQCQLLIMSVVWGRITLSSRAIFMHQPKKTAKDYRRSKPHTIRVSSDTALTARDALHPDVTRVTADMRPPPLAKHGAPIFAVFDEDVNRGPFLGLVTAKTIALSPGLDFRALASASTTPIRPDTPLDSIAEQMASQGMTVVPLLDSENRFVGAVSHQSLLAALLNQERHFLDQSRQLQADLAKNQRQLLELTARMEQWHFASTRLFKLLPLHRMPDELLQCAIEVLTQVIDARYGAIGILANDGTLDQFIHTGLTPEEVQQIGRLPQGKGLLGVVIQEDRLLNIKDISADPHSAGFPPHHPPMSTLLATPISYHGRSFGRLYLSDKNNRQPFCVNDERLVMNFANLLALMLTHMDILNDRERTHGKLLESDARFRTITENAVNGVYILEQDNRFEYVNVGFAGIFGYRPEELMGKIGLMELIHADHKTAIATRISRCLAGETSSTPCRFLGIRKDGSSAECELFCAPSQYQGHSAVIGTLIDRTAISLAEQQMHKLSTAMDQTADTVVITDREGMIEYVNSAFEETTGFSRQEALGNKPSLLKSGMQNEEFFRTLWETVTRGKAFMDIFINRKKSGELFYEEKTITPLKDATGHITHYIATGKDVTERMQTQQRLHFLAYHDILTGLPNRSLLRERLSHAFLQEGRGHKLTALMIMDLDRFKLINDSLGHNIGDLLLRAVADRLRSCLRQSDTIARLGGDEFTVMLENINQPEDAVPVARQIIESFSSPYLIDNHEIFVTPSIGITIHPQDGESIDQLLKNADSAMYRAKEAGGNGFEFFTHDMTLRATRRMENELSLRHALELDEFLLHYQPRINPHNDRVVGLEALLRWRHPDSQIIPPIEFIPLLEETGLIIPVGEWVLRTACRLAREWQLEHHPLRMAVNLSVLQFHDKHFVETVKKILAETELDPGLLELEITEGLFLEKREATSISFAELHAMGVRIAVDDFGTGYSSMSYLKRLPIDILKIDRSFVRDVTSIPDDTAIVRAIIAMAHSLQLTITAEGVETEAQCTFFRDQGCHEIQGYWYARPMPEDELRDWMLARNG